MSSPSHVLAAIFTLTSSGLGRQEKDAWGRKHKRNHNSVSPKYLSDNRKLKEMEVYSEFPQSFLIVCSTSFALWSPAGLSCHSLSPLTSHCVCLHACMPASIWVKVCTCMRIHTSSLCTYSSQSKRTYRLTSSWVNQMWQMSPCSCFTFLRLLVPPQKHIWVSAHWLHFVYLLFVSVFIGVEARTVDIWKSWTTGSFFIRHSLKAAFPFFKAV